MRMAIKMQASKKEMTIGKAFEDFLCEKKILKLAEATIESYEYRFKEFTDFFHADHLCSEVTPTTILKFIEYMQTKSPDIKATSINHTIRSITGRNWILDRF